MTKPRRFLRARAARLRPPLPAGSAPGWDSWILAGDRRLKRRKTRILDRRGRVTGSLQRGEEPAIFAGLRRAVTDPNNARPTRSPCASVALRLSLLGGRPKV